jgi:hypothetical protein
MTDATVQVREGDIFTWSYREPGDDRQWGRYHCCSRIAVVKKGRLCDTYWSWGSDGRSFGLDDLSKLDLTYLGNFDDLDRQPEWQAEYYDDADIVNLNHSNSTRDNFYIRKGAKRSPEKMLAVARKKIEENERAIRSANWSIEKLRAAINRIEAGETSEVFL